MKRWAELIIKLKWLIIIAVVGLTVFFGYQTKSLKINSDVLSSLPDDDPVASLYKKMGTQFGGNDIGMIVMETDNVFKTEVLMHVKQITDSLKITKGISTVTSLTNIIDIKNAEITLSTAIFYGKGDNLFVKMNYYDMFMFKLKYSF